jgi:hypothetical protein
MELYLAVLDQDGIYFAWMTRDELLPIKKLA